MSLLYSYLSAFWSPAAASVHNAAPPGLIDSINSKEFIFQHDDMSFLARPLPRPVAVPGEKKLAGLCTVLRPPAPMVSGLWIDERIKHFQLRDDVYKTGFKSNIILVRGPESPASQLDPSAKSLLREWGAGVAFAVADRDTLSEGPFYAQNGLLHAVWMLCPDTHEAFMTATLPINEAPQVYRKFWCSDGCRLVIGVPSRLYYDPRDDKPLHGLRITVKDNMDMAGMKTTMSCRSWERLYPPSEKTAEAVQRLLDLGAVPVGKTKLSQFAEVEFPTADWVDFHCPFNPRGDGYLNPEGSTTGGAVALAAYDWVDVSIGSDTGGSLREPASRQGLFGLRPTWGRLSLDGVFPLAHSLDTIGLMCRDVDILHRVTAAWFAQGLEDLKSRTSIGKFTQIKVLSDFEYNPGPAKDAFDAFVARFAKAAGLEKNETSLQAVWMEKDPPSGGEDIAEYIGKRQTMRALKAFDLWRATEDFRNKYQQQYGRQPYVNPTVQQRWAEAKAATVDEQRAALDRKSVFTEWFLDSVLCVNSAKELGTITIVPISDANPEYRDTYPTGPWMGGNGFHRNFLSSLTGCPEVMVPIDQITYESRVTKQQEYLPVVVSILGPPGSDVGLTRFVAESLRLAKLPTKVQTGSVAFPLVA